MTQLRFNERVAIITGGGRSIGRSHARFLALRGARVVVNDLGTDMDGTGRDAGPSNQVCEEIHESGGIAFASTHDVSTKAGAEALVAATLKEFGRIDIVINNAGISTRFDFPDVEQADMEKHLAIHLMGSFNVTRASWPHLSTSGKGRVVMTTSSAILGRSSVVSYSTAKSSLIGLTKSLALSGNICGIKVNAVAPVAYSRMGTPNFSDLKGQRTPISPEYASRLVAVLAHESCPTNGEILCVGAGRVSRLFLAETIGYVESDFSPESLLENWSTVMDESSHYVPLDCADHVERLRQPQRANQSRSKITE